MVLGTAYFTRNPFHLEDLQQLHSPLDRHPYIIERTLNLKSIDYENFITDLCADRQYIEGNTDDMYIDKDKVWHCILIKHRKSNNGILVMSGGKAYAQYASIYIP